MAAVERRIRRIRRFQPIERVFRDRNNPLETLSRMEIFGRYRFMPESITVLTGMVFDVLDSPTMRSLPLPPLLSVLVTLNFYATGSHYITIGDVHGISTSSVCRAVKRTTAAICQLLPTFVNFPVDFAATQREFYNIAGFPKVLGCVDGTHVKIQAPSENEPDYVNRKGVHSINVQMVCDARFMITNVVAKWPGSVHDSRIFRESGLCRRFEEGQFDGHLLGDSGYASRQFLLTPYLRPNTPAQERYNEALTKTRVILEQTFGVLKRRFPCLKYGLRVSPAIACGTIAACAILHNFGMVRGDTIQREIVNDDIPPGNDLQIAAGQTGLRYRDTVVERYFM